MTFPPSEGRQGAGEPDALFVADDDRLVPTVLTRGPWSAAHQHGGPPAAILARAIERAAGEPEALQIARFVVDFARPIPIEPLAVRVERVRDGRRAQGFVATLAAHGQELARANALVIRTEAVALPPRSTDEPLLPPPELSAPFEFPFFLDAIGYHTAVETRLARGVFGTGRMAAWMRLRYPLVAGETPSPVQRLLVVADSGSGVGAALDPTRFIFVNADLSVSLHRPPAGDWVGLDATTTIEPHGLGLTRTGLYDTRGQIGQALQSLVVGHRSPQ